MPKKSEIEKKYEDFEANIHMLAEKEIEKIEKEVEKTKEEAEKIGEEIENTLSTKE